MVTLKTNNKPETTATVQTRVQGATIIKKRVKIKKARKGALTTPANWNEALKNDRCSAE